MQGEHHAFVHSLWADRSTSVNKYIANYLTVT